MSIINLKDISGFLKLTVKKNDYVRTLHQGAVPGLLKVLDSVTIAYSLVPGTKRTIYARKFIISCQGARVWIPHSQVVWIGGELTKDLGENGVLEIELEDGNVSTFDIFNEQMLKVHLSFCVSVGVNIIFFLNRKSQLMFQRINQSYLP